MDFLLRYATTQTSVGVQTNRIVVNTTRIAHAYGYEPTIMTFQRNMTMTLSPVLGDGRHSYRPLDAHPVSGMLQHRHGPLNFFFNAELSRLSWYTYDNHPSLDELEERFQKILNTPPMNRWLVLYLISQANMAFCLLFGGDLMSGLFVFLGTFCGFLLRQELNRRHVYHYLTVVLSAFVASFVVGLGAKFGYEEFPKIALSASVLYLIPGVPLHQWYDGYPRWLCPQRHLAPPDGGDDRREHHRRPLCHADVPWSLAPLTSHHHRNRIGLRYYGLPPYP